MPRRGGGWLREAVFSLARMPTPPRFARLPLPEEGARTILDRALPTYNCGEAATSALNPEPKSLRAAKSQNTHPVCSGFSIGGEAAPSFFISPTAGARRQVLPCREAWLCIGICRRSAAVMGSALPQGSPLPPPSSLRYNIFNETLISQKEASLWKKYISTSARIPTTS